MKILTIERFTHFGKCQLGDALPTDRVVSVWLSASIAQHELHDADVVRIQVAEQRFDIPADKLAGYYDSHPYVLIDEHGGLLVDVKGEEFARVNIGREVATELIQKYTR